MATKVCGKNFDDKNKSARGGAQPGPIDV